MGIFIITVFYSFSSNLKNLYLELKNKYTSDSEYLAVITKNGLWIKDIDKGNIKIINAIIIRIIVIITIMIIESYLYL